MFRFLVRLFLIIFVSNQVMANTCTTFYTHQVPIQERIENKLSRLYKNRYFQTAVRQYQAVHSDLFQKYLMTGLSHRKLYQHSLNVVATSLFISSYIIMAPNQFKESQDRYSDTQSAALEARLDSTLENLDALDKALEEKGFYKKKPTRIDGLQ